MPSFLDSIVAHIEAGKPKTYPRNVRLIDGRVVVRELPFMLGLGHPIVTDVDGERVTGEIVDDYKPRPWEKSKWMPQITGSTGRNH